MKSNTISAKPATPPTILPTRVEVAGPLLLPDPEPAPEVTDGEGAALIVLPPPEPPATEVLLVVADVDDNDDEADGNRDDENEIDDTDEIWVVEVLLTRLVELFAYREVLEASCKDVLIGRKEADNEDIEDGDVEVAICVVFDTGSAVGETKSENNALLKLLISEEVSAVDRLI